MTILSFEKPKKVRSTEEHNNTFSSDTNILGTYVPNMSEEDSYKWKAKHIKGDDERIEIRKTISGTQLLVIVYVNDMKYYKKTDSAIKWPDLKKSHKMVKISMNGTLDMTLADYDDMQHAIQEAMQILEVETW